MGDGRPQPPRDASPGDPGAGSPLAVALAGLAALAVAVGIGRFAFTPILPMMQAEAGLSIRAGAWLAAGNYVGYLAGALAAMWARPPAGLAIRAGLLAIAATTLGMAPSSGFATWLALRTVSGTASAWVLVLVSAWCLDRLAAARRPELGGAVYAGVGSGIAIAGVVCLALMLCGARSADAWTALGILSLVVACAVWPVVGRAGADGPQRADGPALWSRDATRLVACYGAWGFGYIVPATFLPAMAREAVADPLVFGWAWPVFGAASIAATVGAGACVRRVGNRRLWVASQATMAAGVALPVLAPGIAAVMVAALVVGSTFMVNTMAGMQEARRVHGAGATRLMAAMTAAFALGQVAGPVAVSALAGVGVGVEGALAIASAVLLAGAYALRARVGTCWTGGVKCTP
ncbi:MAG TPA: YbfB/YjiJ family MFS transporter [Candidatus Tectomicrobia bacterium]|nr:YbfB/YjiJ family MFS transporter [Candidatus Tectomicrobia bacterium]